MEASSEFTNKRRMGITFAPNDPAVASFLKVCFHASHVFFINVYLILSQQKVIKMNLIKISQGPNLNKSAII